MRSFWILALLICMSALSQQATAGEARKLYKWTDKQGQVHYGDQIPPEYADQERHVMNARGIEVDHLDAQKTPEEQAAADAKTRNEAAQRDRDRNLLNSYVSVQEIERLRDQRVALISDQIKVTSNFLETLEARQKKLKTTSMNFRPYSAKPDAPAMPDQIADDLVRTGNDIRAQQENLRHKRIEEANLRKSFVSDIERFKQLKGLH